MMRTAEPVATRSASHDEANSDTAAYAIPTRYEDTAPPPHTPLPGATAITITRGPGVGAQLDIPLAADTTLIGRHPDCDVVLTDVTVSRRHAAIRRDGHTFTMTDLGSLNGTYVNRTPIDHVPLTDGDIVQIGAFRLVFRSGPAEVDSTPGGARPRLAAAAGGWSR